MMKNSKIKNKKEILALSENLKAQGKKIVVYSGTFDILHAGHIVAIQEAARQGDVLIILVNSDRSVKSYKGPNHPIHSQQHRMRKLAELAQVHYVVSFDELTPETMLAAIQPQIYCNGSDWGKNCIERKVVEGYGGKVHVLKWKKGFSTSRLVEKLVKNHPTPDIKAVFLDRDGTINISHEGYVREISQFTFAPRAIHALRKLSHTNYKIIVITNQSGIARKYLNERSLQKIHHWMVKSVQKQGARIDGVYYCPHHPDHMCGCRKPEIGMFLKAAKDFNINLSKSWMIGDDQKDVIAARRANIKIIKIGEKMPKELKLEPHYYAKDILGAVNIITKV